MVEQVMEYKGYTGSVYWHEQYECFYGCVLELGDRLFYAGSDLEKLREGFEERVDTFLKSPEVYGINRMDLFGEIF